jgi:hypothetical protein
MGRGEIDKGREENRGKHQQAQDEDADSCVEQNFSFPFKKNIYREDAKKSLKTNDFG